jgi:predicted amidohydrolase YtcJ
MESPLPGDKPKPGHSGLDSLILERHIMNDALDLIITGHVITMANEKPYARAVGVKSEKIVTVGAVEKVMNYKGPHTYLLALDEKWILPGFIDSHMHPLMTGVYKQGVDLSTVVTIGQTLKKIAGAADRTPHGEWIQCFRYQDKSIAEQRYPTKKELDDVSSRHPIVVMHNDVHFAMLNSRALKLLAVPLDNPGVEKNAEGRATGYISDPAISFVLGQFDAMLTDEEKLDRIRSSIESALAEGVTTLHMKESLNVIQLILEHEKELSIRIKPLVILKESDEMADLDKIILNPVLVDRACICLFGDGTFDGHTGATLEPYADDPLSWGILIWEDAAMYRIMEKAHRAGLQLSVHTVGDRATEQALSIYEALLAAHPRKVHRHRFEHYEIPTMEQIKRTAQSGLTVGMQPMLIPVCCGTDLEGYRRFIGDETVRRVSAFRWIQDEGVLVAGGSDSPVTPIGPLKGIQICLTHPLAHFRLTRHEALKWYTINGSKIGFEEKVKGTIEVGKLADFVVLAQNPYEVSPEKIGDIPVEMTILGGKVVYSDR